MDKKNFLEEILAHRRAKVARDRAAGDERALSRQAERTCEDKKSHRLRAALENGDEIKIIGEFKRASPSLGPIRSDADLPSIVKKYEEAGVCAVSILTEPEFFHGSLEDLRQARDFTNLPILRKDFVVDEYQVLEAAAAGADGVLLIAAALQDAELLKLRIFAEEKFGLDALVEVHTDEEMRRGVNAGATLIGVNNRDLHNFAVSLETSAQLASLAPASAILVSESGISSPAQVRMLRQCGYRAFLVGESLMRATDPAALIRELRSANS